MDAAPTVPYRRIGTILVDRRLITDVQLAHALAEQKETGRPLGEICVDRFSLDRLTLADCLAEQWEEMQRASAAPADEDALETADEAADDEGTLSAEDDMRGLLEEAEAARAELASKTDELSRRLAALETLVVGVSDALAELRPSTDNGSEDAGTATAPQQRRRSSRRTTARR